MVISTKALPVGVMTAGLSSSLRCDWTTPSRLFAFLKCEFNFELDAAADSENALAVEFFDTEKNGLQQTWAPRITWCNPPYGRSIGKWIEKAYRESLAGAIVVMLIPARTDTSWWHDFVITRAAEVRFLRGRLAFDDNRKGRCPFPSAIVVFRPRPTV